MLRYPSIRRASIAGLRLRTPRSRIDLGFPLQVACVAVTVQLLAALALPGSAGAWTGLVVLSLGGGLLLGASAALVAPLLPSMTRNLQSLLLVGAGFASGALWPTALEYAAYGWLLAPGEERSASAAVSGFVSAGVLSLTWMVPRREPGRERSEPRLRRLLLIPVIVSATALITVQSLDAMQRIRFREVTALTNAAFRAVVANDDALLRTLVVGDSTIEDVRSMERIDPVAWRRNAASGVKLDHASVEADSAWVWYTLPHVVRDIGQVQLTVKVVRSDGAWRIQDVWAGVEH